MEIIVKTANAYGKNCFGCKRHERDIMLSFKDEKDATTVHDVFLTTEQAEALVEAIKIRLEGNKES